MRSTHRRGPLSAGELAEAAVLADLSAVLVLAGWLLPFGALIQVAAGTPFAVLGFRRRARAVVIGAIAGGMVAFLVGGPGPLLVVWIAALLGGIVGRGFARNWPAAPTVAVAVVAGWSVVSGMTVGMLAVLSELRELTLEQVRISWRGSRTLLEGFADPEMLDAFDAQLEWLLDMWYLAIPLGQGMGILVAVVVGRAIAVPALRRLRLALPAAQPDGAEPSDEQPDPLPVELRGVRFRYSGADQEALCGVDLRVEPSTFVAVLGDNGSGKSTLTKVLAGAPVAAGQVHRPGSAGLGQPGGTAVIFQRPETQVLGVRVREDVLWGVAEPDRVDVDGLLHAVGLDGFQNRETATLSGGELQRLAVASALARHPALLISDESTSMLDMSGRRELMQVLRRLPRTEGVAVLHVTHRRGEAADADHVVVLAAGRVVDQGPPAQVFGPEAVAP